MSRLPFASLLLAGTLAACGSLSTPAPMVPPLAANPTPPVMA